MRHPDAATVVAPGPAEHAGVARVLVDDAHAAAGVGRAVAVAFAAGFAAQGARTIVAVVAVVGVGHDGVQAVVAAVEPDEHQETVVAVPTLEAVFDADQRARSLAGHWLDRHGV